MAYFPFSGATNNWPIYLSGAHGVVSDRAAKMAAIRQELDERTQKEMETNH